MHVIPDEGERVRPNEISEKLPEVTYFKKDAGAYTSAYDRVLNILKKLDTSYNPTMQKIHEPVIEVNYTVVGYTRVVPIMEHEYDKIQWA